MNTYIARQPILDSKKTVQAFELLYRSGPQNQQNATTEERASAQVIARTLIQFGLPVLAGKRTAHLKIDQDSLVRGTFLDLPTDRVVLELLDPEQPNEDSVQSCRRLKKKGFRIALDEFCLRAQHRELRDLADIVKLDIRKEERWKNRELIQALLDEGKELHADGIESAGQFAVAQALGYSRFQGNYFCRPHVMQTQDSTEDWQVCSNLLGKISKSSINLDDVEAILRTEPSLSYKLLRYLNSASLSRQRRIASIKQALVLLGEEPLRRWASLIALSAMNKNGRKDLLLTSLCRANFAEQISAELPSFIEYGPRVYFCGMLSMLDALLNKPMDDLLEQLELDASIEAVLLGQESAMQPIMALTLAYESGDWQTVDEWCSTFNLDMQKCRSAYLKSVQMAERSLLEC